MKITPIPMLKVHYGVKSHKITREILHIGEKNKLRKSKRQRDKTKREWHE